MSIVLDGTTGLAGAATGALNGTLGATTPSTVVATTVVASSTIKGASTIAVGNATPSASGAGITFPATQSASTDANTLDDYEEGTWTPSLLFGGAAVGLTYSKRLGYYTKIGNIVTATVCIDCNAIGSSTGTATITGLPFASPSNGAMSAATPFAGWSLGNGSAVVAPMIGVYDVVLYPVQLSSGTAPSNLTKTQFGTTSAYVFFTLNYQIA